MRRAILSLSTICALALSANADVNDYVELEQTLVKVSPGITKFKSLDKTRATIDVKFSLGCSFEDKNPLKRYAEYGVSIGEVKLSSQYQDISISNYLVKRKTDILYAIGESFGYLQHDSKTNSGDIEIQKAPYVALTGFFAYAINDTASLNSTATYKISLDRADFKEGYAVDTGVALQNGFSAKIEYQKLNFNGADSQEDISYKLGYMYVF